MAVVRLRVVTSIGDGVVFEGMMNREPTAEDVRRLNAAERVFNELTDLRVHIGIDEGAPAVPDQAVRT